MSLSDHLDLDEEACQHVCMNVFSCSKKEVQQFIFYKKTNYILVRHGNLSQQLDFLRASQKRKNIRFSTRLPAHFHPK